jgi:hypothetical protein
MSAIVPYPSFLPQQRKELVTRLREQAKAELSQGNRSHGSTLLFRASEIELKVGEGPYKQASVQTAASAP